VARNSRIFRPVLAAGSGDDMKHAERYPRGTAYHEAGHAIVAWSFGLQVGTIHVMADDGSGGAQIGPTNHLCLVARIAVCVAGYTAENVFGHPHTNRLAAACDHTRIRKLLEDSGIAEGDEAVALRLKGVNCAGETFLAHKDRVIRLAEKLVQDGCVDDAEFLRLMR
jgi:hypothetical protein